MIFAFIGTSELVLISALALLLFGGKKLPEMMRGLGKGVREFKDGMNDITNPESEQQHSQEPEQEPTETPDTKEES